MMVDPETYYEENLKGKTAEQIISIIRGLKIKIGHLKNKLENPDYSSDIMFLPNDSTRLWCTREYLERAKLALTEAGGEYKPSKAELRALEFEKNFYAIDKIIFGVGDCFGVYETRTVLIDSIDKDKFLNELSVLYLGEWCNSYNPKYLENIEIDSQQWSLEVRYNNGAKSFESHGYNSFPHNFDEFRQLLDAYSIIE